MKRRGSFGPYTPMRFPAPALNAAAPIRFSCECEHVEHTQGCESSAEVQRHTDYGPYRICGACANKGHMPEVGAAPELCRSRVDYDNGARECCTLARGHTGRCRFVQVRPPRPVQEGAR